MLVEDENIIARDISQRLSNLGYDVCALALSADEAIEKAKETYPDLILMDIMLKGVPDGIRVAQELQKDLGVPIIYLTAYEDELTLKRAKETNPYGYILKPFEERELHTAIEIAIYKHRTEKTIQESEEKYRTLAESAHDFIYILDKNLRITYVNDFAIKQLGATRQEILGKSVDKLFPNDIKASHKRALKKVFQAAKAFSFVEKFTFIKGELWLDTRLIPIKGSKGKVTGIMGISRDLTKRVNVERKLKKSSENIEILYKELEKKNEELLKYNRRLRESVLRDSHTGLYNHSYFSDVIESEFYRARRYATPLSLIMLDIDYFKSINDLYGHQFGDMVLRQLAKQLKRMVRRYDIIIRYGGEEFAIISPGTDQPTAVGLARRLLEGVNLYNFGNKKHIVKLKLSVAVSTYPRDKIVRTADMIELADEVLSKVKEAGGDRVYCASDVSEEPRVTLHTNVESNDVNLLKGEIEKLTKQANQGIIESIFAFAKTIELKDSYTGEHVERTVHYATEIAIALNMNTNEVSLIKQASMLHDLGKVGVSDKILLKPAKLTQKEYDEIKKHPEIGADIVRPIQFLHSIIPLIFYHHERWNGKGYPSGLKGEEIPLGARIIALADVYQALGSDRPYRKAYSEQEVVRLIQNGAGGQFDPRIVDIFLKILNKSK